MPSGAPDGWGRLRRRAARVAGSETFRQAVRAAAASGLAWWLGGRLGAPRPTFAVLGVIFSLQDNPGGSVRTAAQRILGVGAGVGIGLVALHGPGLSAPVAAALVLVALWAGTRVRVGPQANTQVAVSAILLLAGGGGWRYALARVWETAMGGAMAVAVSALLWPADPVAASSRAALRLRAALAADLRASPAAFGASPAAARDHLVAVRTHARAAGREALTLPEVLAGARWAPWIDRSALAAAQARLRCIEMLYRHVRALARHAADASAAEGRALPPDLLRAACRNLAAATAALEGPPASQGRTAAQAALLRADAALDALLASVRRGDAPPLLAPAVVVLLRQFAADLRGWMRGGVPGTRG